MIVLEVFLAIVGISTLVILHETGHYLAARAFGMRVTRYSIGLGPAIWRYQPKGSPTTFQVCVLPFLAYVQIAGMNPAEDVDPKDPGLYPNKGVIARIVTIFAGPFANYVTAAVLVFGLATVSGLPDEVPTTPMTVGEVMAGSPAQRAGMKAGDIIVEANGRPVRTMEQLIAATRSRAKQSTDYVVKRGGHRRPVMHITPDRAADGRGVIGVVPQTERRYTPMPVGQAALAAVVLPYRITVAQIDAIIDRVRHRSLDGLAGPVGMGKMVAKQVREGPAAYGWILMLLSVALGMFNLLPFPALDGGRLVFLIYELVTRRRPNERIEATVHTVGLLLLLGLLVLVTFREVTG